ncbi:hypothetical protein C7401_108209 [Paraburkholderia unamae]|uniref:hypothetical protein n=1 Tax=Paraburkholderia unamae TaxID=219649 RepID=UPI000DC5A972|nr:hypothetical protein [Paraburkholderia unamae]RAR61273.1 hypothetical protein C7401_108209 [Paraburkholderia unamae]
MKHWHQARRHVTLAVTGLTLGLAAAGAGVGLWLHALHGGANAGGESASVAAILLGVFLAICAGHELWRVRLR